MIRQSSRITRQQEVERLLRDTSQGLTTAELASRMGVSTRTVQRTLTDLDVVSEGHRYRLEERTARHEAADRVPGSRPSAKKKLSFEEIQEWFKDGPISIAEYNRRAAEAGAEDEFRTYTDDWDGFFQHADAAFGTRRAVKRWLCARPLALGGESPQELLDRGEFERLHQALGRIEHTIIG